MATSSPDSGFIPRKEFIREHRDTANTFALMAISSSNLIRLFSFPTSVVNGLRRMLEQRDMLISFREDVTMHCCEFGIDSKPWTAPKNVYSEKLLLDTISLICQSGYTYLSTIDYGREPDDRLAMTFSKPCIIQQPSSRRSGSPVPGSPSGDGSGSNLHEKLANRRSLFAISFASATVLRVINPPLHSTPAILQAVRSSWPRGVNSEKKVAENTYEFKLKGYKWFQEDTFATDSLRHILTLLSSLDAHSFSLMTSMSLTNRSRVKDLWIFTCPQDESSPVIDSPAPSILDSSPDSKKIAYDPSHSAPAVVGGSHRRYATAPNNSTPPAHAVHARAMTDNIVTQPHPHQADHAVRMPVPEPTAAPYVPEAYRAMLPSTVSENTRNMTGVGTPRYSPASPQSQGFEEDVLDSPPPVLHTALRRKTPSPPARSHSPLRPVSTRTKTPPLLVSRDHGPSAPPYASQPNSATSADFSTPLLSPGVFRDSAFSSSEASCDVPIQWTGPEPLKDPQEQARSLFVGSKPTPAPAPQVRLSAGPTVPGGWQTTPIEEKEEDTPSIAPLAANIFDPHGLQSPGRPVQDVRSLVDAPKVRHGDHQSRKSETGLVGLIAATSSPTPPLPTVPASPPSPPSPPTPILRSEDKGKRKEGHGGGQGWVLVNVDKDTPHTPAASPGAHHGGSGLHPPDRGVVSPAPHSPSGPGSPHATRGSLTPRQGGHEHPGAASPTAKAVVIIDAVETRHKAKAGGATTEEPSMKRFFSLSRKNSHRKPNPDEERPPVDKARSPEVMEKVLETTKTKKQRGVLHKLRLGTPEAPRKEERRSIE
ncbi:hypothetical protein HGRIS_007719 [Hohenbuehelia grisea]|uniref:Uncharacterized protein n=1 Tax=Hohenbuehelia grisea TaxID=104357 RepID=A0ABR3J5Q3_9AGAR